ncbi:MAG: exo-alpha-sialidase, partial [Planctomycetota bacterium]|nr:exo-alpha-sialidase [Planctomycetota bacterium]
MRYRSTALWLGIFAALFCGTDAYSQQSQRDAKHMLDIPYMQGDPARIIWSRMPKLKGEWGMVSKGTPEWKFRLHSYLCRHDGKYWAMWSHGPVVEDHPTQHVRYATSADGVNWSAAREMMGPDPDPEMRYISRGFWLRDGRLLALASRDEARTNGRIFFFGKSLRLLAFEWNEAAGAWEKKGTVFDNAINNFPPKKLPDGNWMMSRRDHKMNKSMLIGGVKSFDDWKAVAIAVPKDGARLEEPFWWVLPDKTLSGLFRDNSRSMRLYRAFSHDNGRTWTRPARTDFPDATSKFNALRTSRGYYVMVSNPNPKGRNPLCLSVSDDGLLFTRMAALPAPGTGTFQYPHMIEHDDHLLVIYSHNKTSIETLKVPFSEIERLRKRTDIAPIIRLAGHENVARTADVEVSSVLDEFVGENAVDGDSSPHVRSTRWVSNSKVEPPHWLVLDFKRPRKIACVRLQFYHGFAAVAYSLQYDRDGQWVNMPGASVSGGDKNAILREFEFSPPIESQRLR